MSTQSKPVHAIDDPRGGEASSGATRSHLRRASLSALRIPETARNRPHTPWARYLFAVVVIALALLAGLAGYQRFARSASPAVTVAAAQALSSTNNGNSTTTRELFVASGYVMPRRSSDVGTKTGGRLIALLVEEGSLVRSGQVIGEIDHSDLDAQLAAARSAIDEANAALRELTVAAAEEHRNAERQTTLAARGLVPPASLQAAESAAAVSDARVVRARTAVEGAAARVRVIETAIENTNIRAPFTGVVTSRRAQIGETISPYGVQGQAVRDGGAVVTIADLTELEIQCEITEATVSALNQGTEADIRLQAFPDSRFAGRVRTIFPSADRSKGTVEARVTLLDPDTRVKPNLTASVTFIRRANHPAGTSPPAGAGATLSIPSAALVERDGSARVWVAEGNVVRSVPVGVRTKQSDGTSLVSGLTPGALVVVNPPPSLVPGNHVTTVTNGQNP